MHNSCGYSRNRVGWTGPRPSSEAVPRYYEGLERAMIDSFSREAILHALPLTGFNVHAVAFLRGKGGKIVVMPYPASNWIDASSPIQQWFAALTQDSSDGAYEFAAILGIGHDRRPFVSSYALSPAIVGPLRTLEGA